MQSLSSNLVANQTPSPQANGVRTKPLSQATGGGVNSLTASQQPQMLQPLLQSRANSHLAAETSGQHRPGRIQPSQQASKQVSSQSNNGGGSQLSVAQQQLSQQQQSGLHPQVPFLQHAMINQPLNTGSSDQIEERKDHLHVPSMSQGLEVSFSMATGSNSGFVVHQATRPPYAAAESVHSRASTQNSMSLSMKQKQERPVQIVSPRSPPPEWDDICDEDSNDLKSDPELSESASKDGGQAIEQRVTTANGMRNEVSYREEQSKLDDSCGEVELMSAFNDFSERVGGQRNKVCVPRERYPSHKFASTTRLFSKGKGNGAAIIKKQKLKIQHADTVSEGMSNGMASASRPGLSREGTTDIESVGRSTTLNAVVNPLASIDPFHLLKSIQSGSPDVQSVNKTAFFDQQSLSQVCCGEGNLNLDDSASTNNLHDQVSSLEPICHRGLQRDGWTIKKSINQPGAASPGGLGSRLQRSRFQLKHSQFSRSNSALINQLESEHIVDEHYSGEEETVRSEEPEQTHQVKNGITEGSCVGQPPQKPVVLKTVQDLQELLIQTAWQEETVADQKTAITVTINGQLCEIDPAFFSQHISSDVSQRDKDGGRSPSSATRPELVVIPVPHKRSSIISALNSCQTPVFGRYSSETTDMVADSHFCTPKREMAEIGTQTQAVPQAPTKAGPYCIDKNTQFPEMQPIKLPRYGGDPSMFSCGALADDSMMSPPSRDDFSLSSMTPTQRRQVEEQARAGTFDRQTEPNRDFGEVAMGVINAELMGHKLLQQRSTSDLTAGASQPMRSKVMTNSARNILAATASGVTREDSRSLRHNNASMVKKSSNDAFMSTGDYADDPALLNFVQGCSVGQANNATNQASQGQPSANLPTFPSSQHSSGGQQNLAGNRSNDRLSSVSPKSARHQSPHDKGQRSKTATFNQASGMGTHTPKRETPQHGTPQHETLQHETPQHGTAQLKTQADKRTQEVHKKPPQRELSKADSYDEFVAAFMKQMEPSSRQKPDMQGATEVKAQRDQKNNKKTTLQDSNTETTIEKQEDVALNTPPLEVAKASTVMDKEDSVEAAFFAAMSEPLPPPPATTSQSKRAEPIEDSFTIPKVPKASAVDSLLAAFEAASPLQLIDVPKVPSKGPTNPLLAAFEAELPAKTEDLSVPKVPKKPPTNPYASLTAPVSVAPKQPLAKEDSLMAAFGLLANDPAGDSLLPPPVPVVKKNPYVTEPLSAVTTKATITATLLPKVPVKSQPNPYALQASPERQRKNPATSPETISDRKSALKESPPSSSQHGFNNSSSSLRRGTSSGHLMQDNSSDFTSKSSSDDVTGGGAGLLPQVSFKRDLSVSFAEEVDSFCLGSSPMLASEQPGLGANTKKPPQLKPTKSCLRDGKRSQVTTTTTTQQAASTPTQASLVDFDRQNSEEQISPMLELQNSSRRRNSYKKSKSADCNTMNVAPTSPLKTSPQRVLAPIEEEVSDFKSSNSNDSSSAARRMGQSKDENDTQEPSLTDQMVRYGTAFSSGVLRNDSVDLTYLPRVKPRFKIEPIATTGNVLDDFVKRQASGLGLNPKIFLDQEMIALIQDQSQSQEEATLRSTSQFTADIPREDNQIVSQVSTSTHFNAAPEVIEVASILGIARAKRAAATLRRNFKKLASSSDALQKKRFSALTTGAGNAILPQKVSMRDKGGSDRIPPHKNDSANLDEGNVEQSQDNEQSSEAKRLEENLSQQLSEQDAVSQASVARDDRSLSGKVKSEVRRLHEETLKNRLQLSILNFYLKAQKLEEDKKIQTLNNSIKVITSHEMKLREMSLPSQAEKTKLHFAFCFASPLVISGKKQCDQDKNIYKLMPPLNFQKEFLKIRDSIESAKVKMRITKRQCTTNTLNEILAKNPLGIHFSGHGLLNTEKELGPELFKMYMNQGNFLLLETEDGSGSLVSTQTLQQMISKNYLKDSLQLVVVATCHSEFVGEIFQEAGARHVICIHQEYEVEDDAVITFTDSFYGLLFNGKKICDAFEQAIYQVSLTHSEQQASIFKLLKYEDSSSFRQRLLDQELRAQGIITSEGHSVGGGRGQAGADNPKFRRDNSMTSLYSQGVSREAQKRKLRREGSPDSVTRSLTHLATQSSQMPIAKSHHFCSIFGPFDSGKVQFIEGGTFTLRNTAPLQTTLIGRAVDKFRLVQNVLNNKASRLITLYGLPGVGKTSLVRSTLQWMEERVLLRGGSIYYNASDISCSVSFTRKLCLKVVADNARHFKTVRQHKDFNGQQPMKMLKLVIANLIRIQGDILLIIDNCEDLIQKDKTNFRKLVSYFLQRVPSMKVLLTSRVLLHYAAEFKEETIQVLGLSDKQSAGLFCAMAREIEQDEKNRLLDLEPDYERFPMERLRPRPRRLHEHHLFNLLNGNPQSIILTAPVLSNQESYIDLPELYKMLTSDRIYSELRRCEVDNKMLASLRLSAQVSVQHVVDNDGESLDLFFLMGLLPGGISQFELDDIWHRVQKSLHDIESDDLSQYSARKSTATRQQQSDDLVSTKGGLRRAQTRRISSNLTRAIKELVRGKIVERVTTFMNEEIHQQPASASAEVSGERQQTSMLFAAVDQNRLDALITMPEYVRNFSEGLIDESRFETLHKITAIWLKGITKKQYLTKSDINATESPITDEAELERLDKNFDQFLARVQADYLDESKSQMAQEVLGTADGPGAGSSGADNSRNNNTLYIMTQGGVNDFDDYSDMGEESEDGTDPDKSINPLEADNKDDSSGSSGDENPFLKQMLDKEADARVMQRRQAAGVATSIQVSSGPLGGVIDPPGTQTSGLGANSTSFISRQNQTNTTSFASRKHSMIQSRQRALTKRRQTQQLKQQQEQRRPSQGENGGDWKELDEAENALQARISSAKPEVTTLVRRSIELMSRKTNLPMKLQQAKNPDDRAKIRWRMFFNKVTETRQDDKIKAISGLTTLGGITLEEEEEHFYDQSTSVGDQKVNYGLAPHHSNQRKQSVNKKLPPSKNASGSQKIEVSKLETITERTESLPYQDSQVSKLTSQPQDDPKQEVRMQTFAEAFKSKYMATFDEIRMIQMRFPRGSLCLRNRTQALLHKDTHGIESVQGESLWRYKEQLSLEERVILYHLATKVLYADWRYVTQIVKKTIVKMHKASRLFKGNVRRFQAYCLMKEFDHQQVAKKGVTTSGEYQLTHEKMLVREMEIEDCLVRALHSFELDNCMWGLGLAFLQEAIFINSKLKVRTAVLNSDAMMQAQATSGTSGSVHVTSGGTFGFNGGATREVSKSLQTPSTGKQCLKDQQFSSQRSRQSLELKTWSVGVRQEHKTLLKEFFESAGHAIQNLRVVRHVKGLSFIYKLVSEVTQENRVDEETLREYSQGLQGPGQSLTQSFANLTAKSATLPSDEAIFLDARKKQAEFQSQYRRAIEDKQEKLKAICIQREQGDDVSLVMEIVHTAKALKIFDHTVFNFKKSTRSIASSSNKGLAMSKAVSQFNALKKSNKQVRESINGEMKRSAKSYKKGLQKQASGEFAGPAFRSKNLLYAGVTPSMNRQESRRQKNNKLKTGTSESFSGEVLAEVPDRRQEYSSSYGDESDEGRSNSEERKSHGGGQARRDSRHSKVQRQQSRRGTGKISTKRSKSLRQEGSGSLLAQEEYVDYSDDSDYDDDVDISGSSLSDRSHPNKNMRQSFI